MEQRVNWFSRLLGRGSDDADEGVVVVPIPPLVTILQHKEAAKGFPLTESEVLDIRDQAVCMTMRRSHANQLAEKRGFADIDPSHAWEEWLQSRS
jgi:hypothetical protein